VRGDVPIFGLADSPHFALYRVEFGEGVSPLEWRLIKVSGRPEGMDPWATGKVRWDPNRGAQGNLATWHTGLTSYQYGRQTQNLNGVYTIRLIVVDQSGITAEARVLVNVARVLTREQGGIAESCDGKAFLNAPPSAIAVAFLLVAIQPVDAVRNPPPIVLDHPRDLASVGRTYEVRPTGMRFTRPVALRLQYTDDDLRTSGVMMGIAEDRLGIYAYEKTGVWRRMPGCEVRRSVREVATTVREVPRSVAFYAIMADVTPPETPTLEAEAAETERSKMQLSGKAEPYSTVQILDGETVKSTAEVSGEGTFSVPTFPLKEGENALSARAVDGAGNKSSPSAPLKIVRRLHPPKLVKTMEILGMLKAERGRRYLAMLVGEDSDTKVNTGWARVCSESDPKGVELELTETGPQTGVYVATFLVRAKTDPAKHIIAASRHGEKITAVPAQDSTKLATIEYVDIVPPTAPAIESGTHPSVCQDGFEEGANPFGQWANIDEEYGALCTRETRRGQCFLKLTKQQDQGHLGAWARQTAYSAARFPLVVFDYLLNPEVKMDCQVNYRGWQLVEFNDYEGEDPAFGRKAIGRFQGIISDGQWHSATLNLASILAARSPGDAELKVEGIQFINWDKPAYMKLQFGRTGQKGSYWCVDNFRISGFGGPRAEFKWSSEDENGTAGYSYVFDRKPDTIPPEKSMGTVTEKTFDGLADGRWYLHVRAVDKPGNWGPTNHYMIFVDTKPPTAQPVGPTGKVAWDTPVQIRFDDSNGSGVNPYSLRLKVGGTVYSTDSDALNLDPEKQVLTSDPKAHTLRSPDGRSVEKVPLLFADGERVDVELVAAADHAKHAMAELPSWSYEVTSPLKVTPANPDGKNGWYVSPPKIEMKAPEGSKLEYTWAVPVEEDDLFRKGNSINRLTVTVAGKDGKPQRYVKPFRLDTTVPKVTAKVIPEKAGPDGVYAQPPTIELVHDDYAVVDGGLTCLGYASEDCTGAPLYEQQKVALGAYHPPAEFASKVKSVRWTGRLRPPETGIYKLWLSSAKDQSAHVYVNDDLILDSSKADKQSQEVGADLLLVRKMHALDVRWLKAGKANPGIKLSWQKEKADNREDLPTDALFFLRSLAKVYCRWDEGKEAEYAGPLLAPRGRHVLHFRAMDDAGHAGPEAMLTLEVAK